MSSRRRTIDHFIASLTEDNYSLTDSLDAAKTWTLRRDAVAAVERFSMVYPLGAMALSVIQQVAH